MGTRVANGQVTQSANNLQARNSESQAATVKDEDEFVCSKDIARRLGVHVSVIWKKNRDGQMPKGFRLSGKTKGRGLKFVKTEIEKWIQVILEKRSQDR